MKKLYIILVLSLSAFTSKAQFGEWEVGPFIGWALYQGDLIPKRYDLDQTNLAFGFTSRYNYYYNFNIRGNLLVGRISASDDDYPDTNRRGRGYSFSTSVIEISALAEYEPLGKMRQLQGGKSKLRVSPYVMGGMGLAFTNPKPTFPRIGNPDSQNPIIQDVRAGYSKIHLALPLGGGVRFDVTSRWMIGAEVAGRYAFTDYLDGISLSANPKRNDWYWFGGFTAMYRLD
jgi:opacity protein-like surface antigen